MELREDIESFFGDLKVKHGLVEEDATPPPPPTAPLDEAREAMEEHRDTPEAPAIPEADEVSEDDPRYPGSKQLRRSIAEAPVEVEEDEDPIWDDRPRVYAVRGKDTELFPISALARALRREPVTMRKWETKGYLPSARYRSPGEGKKQDRLYTRAQIEGLIAIAKAEGLMNPKKKLRIDQTDFPDRAHRLFEALEQRSNG